MSLSQEEKEQVAVLLGYVKCKHDDDATHWNGIGEEWPACIPERDIFTLEACMEYAKGKGWGHTIYWNGTYEAELFHMGPGIGGLSFADTEDQPDPLTAMVRALLKAEEASR